MTQLGLPLVDDEESRRLIRELLDETLFVEAGAGTGKTTALVDRYVSLVVAGRGVQQLVAITFTEKAAAELRDRVRGELEHRLSLDADSIVLQDSLVNLDRAQISTIHAFALGVLRSFAAETGINPSFSVQDEVAAERRFEDSWRNHLEHLGQDASARQAINRVLELGLWTSDIEKLAHELWRNTAVAEILHAAPLQAASPEVLDLAALQRALVELHIENVPAGDLLLATVREVLHAVQQLIAAPEAYRDTLLATLVPSLRVSSNGRSANWGAAGAIDRARSTASEVCDALKAALQARRSEGLAAVLPLLVGFVIDESRSRLRDGDLMFDDLILQLRNVLRDNPGARRSLRARYSTLLIDEFQDTDPLQTEIALAFARDDSGAIEPGRVFLVGDPKQSIYRFRHADMTVYAETRATVEAGGGRLPQLAMNRRSRDVILQFVNQTFATIIGVGLYPSVQAPYRAVLHLRNERLAGPDVARIGGVSDDVARTLRAREAGQVAAYCRAALEQGWQVAERNGRVRTARYRDIAVLVPTRAILQPLERAFATAGVPYRVEGGSLVYATQDVRDLINCLTAIDDTTDDIAVVGALRSPAYACSDVELARHRLTGSTFNFLSPDLQPGTSRVADALIDLRAFHETRHAATLAALVERFVAEHRTVEAGLYDSGNRNAFRRARFLVEQARLFESERPESLRSFIVWLERRAGDAILDHEGAGLDDDEDSVRVLTIHAAKGLEFPIVFVAGLGVSPSSQPSTIGLDRTTGAIAVSIGSSARNHTLGPVAAINAVESRHQTAERDRLLYVAATRARDHLVLSLYHQARARNTGAQSLIAAGVLESAVQLPDLEVQDVPFVPFEGLSIDPVEVADEDFYAVREQLVAGATRLLVTSATAMGRLQEEEEEREDESEPWARGRAGTHRGRAVHAALQVLPWDAGDEAIDALASAQSVAEAIPGEAGTVAGLLHRALAMDATSRARAARRSLREVPFALTEGDVTLEGFIDVVLEADDGSLEIIDWKTDAVPEAAVPQRLEDYRLQAGLYVLGLERATERPVRRVTYVFIAPGVEVSAGDPSELAADALATLRSRAIPAT